MRFNREKINALKNLITNKIPSSNSDSPELAKVQKTIFMQAGLAFLTIILTLVILFAVTSAWYTNIVQTSGLVFEVESWGFQGEILVNTDVIKAAPGDEGTVEITAKSEGEGITTIDATVSKAAMSEDMKKRLFFYVDTTATRDGETMERVYINNSEKYTYTVFSGGSLTLGEKVSNAPKLKWHWVYDVLGYYVLAEPSNTAGGKLEVIDYLRPIEYDYDEATFEYSKGANASDVGIEIKTVDGTTTPEEFIVDFSGKDGYEGTINTAEKTDGFYPVKVDEDGYGVYAYLCSYIDVFNETKTDATFAENAGSENPAQHIANLTLSAQKSEDAPESIGTLTELQKVITEGTADYVQLTHDITLSENDKITIPENARIMIDLNGNTIKNQSSGNAIEASVGSSLTMLNGTLEGTGDTGKGIETVGAEVTLNNVNITGFDRGINVSDNINSNDKDSVIRIVNCEEISGKLCAVFVSGNGEKSEQKTQVIIENSKLISEGYGIVGNGSDGRWGTDIQVIESTITSTGTNGTWGTAIYQPQRNSTLTVYKGTISGLSGIIIKGGYANVIDSTVNASAAFAEPKKDNSGASVTGAAIYIETNYGHEIGLEISGDTTVKSVNGYAVQVFEDDASNVSVKISQGSFTSASNKEGKLNDSWIAEGSKQDVSENKYFASVSTETVTG